MAKSCGAGRGAPYLQHASVGELSRVEISLIQLKWLASMAFENSKCLCIFPDFFMCTEAACSLSRLASMAPHLLKPAQADGAIEYATRFFCPRLIWDPTNIVSVSRRPSLLSHLTCVQFCQGMSETSKEKARAS